MRGIENIHAVCFLGVCHHTVLNRLEKTMQDHLDQNYIRIDESMEHHTKRGLVCAFKESSAMPCRTAKYQCRNGGSDIDPYRHCRIH